MEKAVQYLVDGNGNKSSVLIPVPVWNDMNDKYSKLLKKVRVLTGIQNGLKEVADAKKSGKKLQSLNDFLNESNG